MQNPDGTSSPAEHLNQSVTRVVMWEGFDKPENVEHTLSTNNDRLLSLIGRHLDDKWRYAIGVYECEQIFGLHSSLAPAWVASDDEEFAQVLSEHFECPVGEPMNLLTNSGRDAAHLQHLGGSGAGAQPAQFGYMGLANNATATSPNATDTTLTGEITTGGGGLIRAQVTYAHTGGTNTTTLTKTFTANGTDSLPVTISQMAIFNASSAGTMAYKTALNANATLTTSGDSITVTETVTLG